jgi:hypothetical protein
MAIPAVYDWAHAFAEGLVLIKLNERYGFVDAKGNMAIPAVYDSADDFSEGLAPVRLNGKWGYIDAKGTQYWDD